MLFALALVLVQALAIEASAFSRGSSASDIEALCARKSVRLTSLTRLKELAQDLDASSCPSTVKQAIPELVAIVERGSSDLCSVQSIDQLRAFYAKYLDTSSTADHKNKEKLPRSLRRFVLAYGLQMSNLCKRNMLRVLTEEGRSLLAPEDFKPLEELTGDGGAVAQMLGSLAGPDDVLMPGDLAPFMKKGGTADKMFLQTATGGYIKELQSVCQRRFRPIYGPLMVSLVRLSNIGFNYKTKTLKTELQSPAVVREVGQWSRIVFVCESLSNIHIVESQSDSELAEGTGAKLVRLITKEEAAAIEGPIAEGDSGLDTFVYAPHDLVTLGDEIYDDSDPKLAKAIKWFKTSRSEEKTIKKRMVGKGFALIKEELKQGHVGLLASATYKSLLHRIKGGENVDAREELVKLLDQSVKKQAGQQGGD